MDLVNTILDFILDVGVITSALIGLLLTLFVLHLRRFHKYKLPPGPPGYPLLGNLLELRGKPSHKLFFEWSKKYGPVNTVYIGPQLNIILNNAEVALEALVTRKDDFAGRPQSISMNAITDGGRNIANGEGPTWKLHRKLASKAIRQFMRGPVLEETIHSNIEIVIDRIKREEAAIDPTEYIMVIMLNIVCGVCFGQSYDLEDKEFKKLCEVFREFLVDNDGVFLEDFIPLLHRCPTRNFKKFVKCAEWLFNLVQTKLAEHRQDFDPKNIRDLTDALLVAQAEEDLGEDKEAMSLITDRHIIQTISDVFGAGSDTTKTTTCFALKYMAAYPEVQAKVYEEISKAVGFGRLPKLSDKDNLCYTNAVIHEVLRIHPIAPLALPHKTACDTSVGGFDVPKGTQVVINLWALHHDTNQWENAEEFRPERFLDSHGKMVPKPESWLPFSAGRRVCLGESVAKLELVVILSCFIQRFNVRFPEGITPDMQDDTSVFFLTPKPFKIIFEERGSVGSE